jgi:hypothetical protein
MPSLMHQALVEEGFMKGGICLGVAQKQSTLFHHEAHKAQEMLALCAFVDEVRAK